MKVKLRANNFISSQITNPQIGEIREVDEEFGRHLCSLDLAEDVSSEKKPQADLPVSSESQAVEPSSALPQGLPLPKKIATKPKAKGK